MLFLRDLAVAFFRFLVIMSAGGAVVGFMFWAVNMAVYVGGAGGYFISIAAAAALATVMQTTVHTLARSDR